MSERKKHKGFIKDMMELIVDNHSQADVLYTQNVDGSVSLKIEHYQPDGSAAGHLTIEGDQVDALRNFLNKNK